MRNSYKFFSIVVKSNTMSESGKKLCNCLTCRAKKTAQRIIILGPTTVANYGRSERVISLISVQCGVEEFVLFGVYLMPLSCILKMSICKAIAA